MMSGKEQKIIQALIPRLKLWLELDGEMILGRGGALLLRGIEEHGSISQAVKALPQDALGEMPAPSYRFAWGYLKKVEKRLGIPVVEKRRGHRKGPGGTALTDFGKQLLSHYEQYEDKLQKALEPQ
ncbi:MAG: winged helix-turn-helix domain-containing protein [Candidatus Hodarchaeota archaeon]